MKIGLGSLVFLAYLCVGAVGQTAENGGPPAANTTSAGPEVTVLPVFPVTNASAEPDKIPIVPDVDTIGEPELPVPPANTTTKPELPMSPPTNMTTEAEPPVSPPDDMSTEPEPPMLPALNTTNEPELPTPPVVQDPTLETDSPNTTEPELPETPNGMDPTLETDSPNTTEPELPETPNGKDPTSENVGPPEEPPMLQKLPCYDNTTVLFDHVAAKDTFVTEEFVLCPNTVFEIGVTPYPLEPKCCLDGMTPLGPRSNTIIKCGNDGNPANNCTLIKGQFQVISSYTNYFEHAVNAEFHGITFMDSGFSSLILSADGNVLFKDCVFKRHTNVAPVISYYIPPSRRRRLERRLNDMKPSERMGYAITEYTKLFSGEESAFGASDEEEHEEEYMGEHDEERKLQSEPTGRQKVTFDGCEFSENRRGVQGGEEKFGVITAETSFDDFTIKNTLFSKNVYGDALDAKGYAISMEAGNTLELENNCFVDNDLIGQGLIILKSKDTLTKNTNNFATRDPDLYCQFVSIESEDGSFTCIDNDADSCSITSSASLHGKPLGIVTAFSVLVAVSLWLAV